MKTKGINPQTGQIMIDQYGNPMDVWMYDYGQGAPGPLLRHMHTEFLTVNPVNNTDYTNRTSATGPHTSASELHRRPLYQPPHSAGGIYLQL
jgi:hypothetical protein